MNVAAIVAIILSVILLGTLIFFAAKPKNQHVNAEVYLYTPKENGGGGGGGYNDFRHAYTDAVAKKFTLATEQQIRDSARNGAFWRGLGFGSDGYLYAMDGSGTPLRYEQHDNNLKTKQGLGLLLYTTKPTVTSEVATLLAPWNEQGHGHSPVWSQRVQLYPNFYKNRLVKK